MSSVLGGVNPQDQVSARRPERRAAQRRAPTVRMRESIAVVTVRIAAGQQRGLLMDGLLAFMLGEILVKRGTQSFIHGIFIAHLSLL